MNQFWEKLITNGRTNKTTNTVEINWGHSKIQILTPSSLCHRYYNPPPHVTMQIETNVFFDQRP